MAITLEQAVQALISNGYFFDDSYEGPGICLHNDGNLSFVLHNGKLRIAQYFEPYGKGFIAPANCDVIFEYALAECYINGKGELALGKPIAREIKCYD